MNEEDAALRYHERTKHSVESLRRDLHYLDWENQPIPFKIYRGLSDAAKLPLPPVGEPRGPGAFEALTSAGEGEGALTLESLSRLLFHAAGVTKRRRHAGGEMLFRAAACTGALYHIDLYVAAGPLEGLEAGVYHYDPREHALERLRSGDPREALARATGEEPRVSRAAAVVVAASTYWRNAWKYRARAYRHVFWDGGTILAHAFAEARALDLSAHIALGFVDADVERLLGLDPDREGVAALVALSSGAGDPPPAPEATRLELETEPLSPEEIDYPLVRETHRAGALADGGAVAAWRDRSDGLLAAIRDGEDGATGDSLPLPLAPERPDEPLERVIRRRGSSRRFLREPIDAAQLAAVLETTRASVPADVLPEGGTLSRVYVIANDVRGVEPGAYVYEPETRSLGTLKRGDFRREARYLDLEQDLAGEAAANLYVLVDLEAVVSRLGTRGYRAAQLEGGILGGRGYLAAYALGLGATGLTFYDDAVSEFFSPHAAGKAVMFLLAVGVSGKRKVLFET